MYMVGGRGARATGIKGSIAWALQYINDEPALCMWRASGSRGESNRLGSGHRVFAICLSSLYKYVDDSGNVNVPFAVQTAMREVGHMRFGDEGKAKSAVHNIVDVIAEHLEDLLKMKPRPDGYTDTLAEEVKLAEVLVRDNGSGKILHEGELRG